MVVIKVKLKNGDTVTQFQVGECSISENILKIKNFTSPTIHYPISNVDSIVIDISAPQQVKFMTAESR